MDNQPTKVWKTSDFDYELPKERIAQTPVEPRDHARMLVYHRENGTIEHKHFYDLCEYLRPGDVLVINHTKVIPARLFASRMSEHATKEKNCEILLLKRLNYTDWECITRPAKKLKVGTKLEFADDLHAEVIAYGEEGVRTIRFLFDGIFEDIIDRIGNMPLPPYITEKLKDSTRYQTVYADVNGSAAAPTAGLHFTPELLQKIRDMGVEIVPVLLHVGLGTFRPVKEDEITKHKMHSEYYEMDEYAATRINAAVDENRRVICVGTTSVRVVESIADESGHVRACKGNTEIFIYPGYRFKVMRGLITNFHLPQSTLIMLVSAWLGREQTLAMYRTAVEQEYRFFSFGDATLLL